MNLDEMKAKLSSVLSDEFGIDENQITPEANFRQDLDINSLDAVDLIVLLEEETGIKFKTLDLMKIKTVQDLYNLIEENLSN